MSVRLEPLAGLVLGMKEVGLVALILLLERKKANLVWGSVSVAGVSAS